MHELSIALSIIETAEEEAAKRGAWVSAVHLKIGPLSGVLSEALTAAFEMAAQGTSLQGSRLVIEEVPIVIDCRTCGERRTLGPHQPLWCPVCETPSSAVLQGTELLVTALELKVADSAAGSRTP